MVNYDGSFVLYGSAFENLLNIEKFFGAEKAWAFAKAIMQFGFDGEIPDENSELWAYGLSPIIASIGAAKNRYEASIENGKKGGRPRKIDRDKVVELKNEGYTNQEVADALNCSLSSVERANAENRQNQKNPNENINNNIKSDNNEKENNNVNENYYYDENYYYNDDYLNSFAIQSEKEIEMMQQRRIQNLAF